MDCTVVITTTGRPTLKRAIDSALAQEGVRLEVIVVNVSGRSLDVHDKAVRIISAEAGKNANYARQLGIALAIAPIIALLDDDDEWLPGKLVSQLSYFTAAEFPAVIGCRMIIRRSGIRDQVSPREPVSGRIAVPSYLFRRARLRDPLHQLQTSTLIFPRSLAMSVPFDENLEFHQDWDWVLRAQKFGAAFYQIPDAVSIYHVSLVGVTKSTRWKESLDWGRQSLPLKSRELGDFCLVIPFNMAIGAGDARGAMFAIAAGFRHGRPGLHAILRAFLKLFKMLSMRPFKLRVRAR